MNATVIDAVYIFSHEPCYRLLSASEMTYIVSSGALNSTHSLTIAYLLYLLPRSTAVFIGIIFHEIELQYLHREICGVADSVGCFATLEYRLCHHSAVVSLSHLNRWQQIMY